MRSSVPHAIRAGRIALLTRMHLFARPTFVRPIRRAVWISIAIVALAGLIGTQARAADETDYVGKGQLVVQTVFGGDSKLTVGGDIAFESHASLVRIDILSLAIPGAGAALSTLLGTQLFPPGGFTVIFDRKTSVYTVWSNAKRTFFTSAPIASPGPQATPSPSPGASNDIAGPFAFAKSAKDDTAFVASLSLAGHGPINGHPATGIDYLYQRTTKTGEKSDIHGRVQLADDLDAFPVQLTASVKTKNIPESSFRLDLTSVTKGTPSEGDFVVPRGYTRATSLGDVIGKTLTPG